MAPPVGRRHAFDRGYLNERVEWGWLGAQWQMLLRAPSAHLKRRQWERLTRRFHRPYEALLTLERGPLR